MAMTEQARRFVPTSHDNDAALRVVGHDGVIDLNAAEDAVRTLLRALGRDPHSPHLVGTPRRVAAAFAELLTPETFEMTTFDNEEDYDELVTMERPARSAYDVDCPR
jgi:GTP cyclohydrolase I